MKLRLVIIGLSASLLAGQVAAADSPPIARPYDSGQSSSSKVVPSVASDSNPERASDLPILRSAANHIIAQQCRNGGYGWPHASCSTTYYNITAPISLGVLNAYGYTFDASHLAAAVRGGDYSLTNQYLNGEMRMNTKGPFFLSELSPLATDPTYSNFVEQFFDELTAGTYGPNDRDTAGWIAEIVAYRQGASINLIPWEFSLLPAPAAFHGNPGQEMLFENATLSGLNTLDNTNLAIPWDSLGLAGAVHGLAISGRLVFPAIVSPLQPDINGLTTLESLAAVLAAYQNADGSWYWHSNLPVPNEDDKVSQTTAVAVLALKAASLLTAENYEQNILDAQSWLEARQLVGGGFETYPGGGFASANTMVEGEVLSALTVTPLPVELMSFSIE